MSGCVLSLGPIPVFLLDAVSAGVINSCLLLQTGTMNRSTVSLNWCARLHLAKLSLHLLAAMLQLHAILMCLSVLAD